MDITESWLWNYASTYESVEDAIASTCLYLCAFVTALAISTNFYSWPFSLEILSHFQAQCFMGAITLTTITFCLKQAQILEKSLSTDTHIYHCKHRTKLYDSLASLLF